MRYIDTFDDAWRFRQFEYFSKPGETFFRVDIKHFRLGVSIEFTTFFKPFEHAYFVPQNRRAFKIHCLTGSLHLAGHLSQKAFLATFHESHQPPDVFAVVLLIDPQIAGRGALIDACQQTRTKPLPAFIGFTYIK